MKYRNLIPLILLVPLLLAGCLNRNRVPDGMAAQVEVFGVQMFSDADYREINGVVATEEPCLKGYERSFDALDVSIGYGVDRKIRKITTRNPSTSLFGVKPGMTFQEGRRKIVQAGFSESVPPFTFRTDAYSLTFLVDGDKIFGMRFESRD